VERELEKDRLEGPNVDQPVLTETGFLIQGIELEEQQYVAHVHASFIFPH
jgi:hypothetical protein